MKNSPVYSFGKSNRAKFFINDGQPGPTAYTLTQAHQAAQPSWKIGTSQRANLVTSKTPGPGNYE